MSRCSPSCAPDGELLSLLYAAFRRPQGALRCAGEAEHDLPELDAAIKGHHDGWPVVVDLTATEFTSSAGLHVLLRDRLEQVALVCPPGNVRRVLDIVHAELCVPIFSNFDTAIQSLTLSHSECDQVTSAGQSRR